MRALGPAGGVAELAGQLGLHGGDGPDQRELVDDRPAAGGALEPVKLAARGRRGAAGAATE